MRVLVSGASSGLGKYLAEYFLADRYDRAAGKATAASYDTIIHCAFDVRRQVPAEEEAQHQRNTLGITQDLLGLPHKRFVFISSCDVYPASGITHKEEETIEPVSLPDRYGKSKLACEQLVQMQSENPLILRPTAMLGPYIRPNSLTKILSGESPKLTLAPNSSFNYVLHEDMAAFIALAEEKNLCGIYNIAAAANVTLSEICNAFGKTAQFGDYRYETGAIDNRRAAALLHTLSKNSLEAVRRFCGS